MEVWSGMAGLQTASSTVLCRHACCRSTTGPASKRSQTTNAAVSTNTNAATRSLGHSFQALVLWLPGAYQYAAFTACPSCSDNPACLVAYVNIQPPNPTADNKTQRSSSGLGVSAALHLQAGLDGSLSRAAGIDVATGSASSTCHMRFVLVQVDNGLQALHCILAGGHGSNNCRHCFKEDNRHAVIQPCCYAVLCDTHLQSQRSAG